MNPTENNLPRSTTLPMLLAMNRRGLNIYPGTADPVVVAGNRRRNKAARKARRMFRRSNARKGVR